MTYRGLGLKAPPITSGGQSVDQRPMDDSQLIYDLGQPQT